jgi:hypothetical protein
MDAPCDHLVPNFCCRKLKALQRWKRKREEKDEKDRGSACMDDWKKKAEEQRAYYNDTEAGQAELKRVCGRVMKAINGGRLVAYHMPHPILNNSKLHLTLVTDKTQDWAMDGPYRLRLFDDEHVVINIPCWFLDQSIRLH